MENKSFETFRQIGPNQIANLTSPEPYAFNGGINVLKYKVTIELVEESKDIYEQRLQRLWDVCDNPNYYKSFIDISKEMGIKLTCTAGKPEPICQCSYPILDIDPNDNEPFCTNCGKAAREKK